MKHHRPLCHVFESCGKYPVSQNVTAGPKSQTRAWQFFQLATFFTFVRPCLKLNFTMIHTTILYIYHAINSSMIIFLPVIIINILAICHTLKLLSPHQASQPLFGKSDWKNRLFKFKIIIGSLQELKVDFILKTMNIN